jgi:hypothetical protein
MSEAIDYALIEKVRAQTRARTAPTTTKRKHGTSFRVPDLLSCAYDPCNDAFHIVFEDLVSADVPRNALHDVANRAVAAWALDELRRGVQTVLNDGEITSFSAEFARTFGDPEYREWAASGRSSDAELARRLADRVRTLRLQRGWTVAELARRARMAAPNIHRVEAAVHVPSTQTMLRLAQALDVPLARLVEIRERASGRRNARRGSSGRRT